MDIVVLNGILQDFYANVRTSSGDYYSKSSLAAIRQGIRHYLQEEEWYEYRAMGKMLLETL